MFNMDEKSLVLLIVFTYLHGGISFGDLSTEMYLHIYYQKFRQTQIFILHHNLSTHIHLYS